MTPGIAKLSAIVLAILATLLFIPEYRVVENSSAAVVYEGGVLNSAQSTPRIEVHSGWGKTHLKVAIVPSGSPAFDEAMRNAVELWYGSIRAFTARYGYRYLESLSYEITDGSADITMQYVDSLPGNYCGLATWWYDPGSGIGMTVRATVKVSKSCVGTSISLAYIVAAHEYGHALGVDHATDRRDIMYPYVTGTAKLSTLNLYALAVVYSWVQGGVFTPPSERTVSLPNTIPYELIEPPSPRRQVRVFIQSELGRVLLATHDVAFGSVFEMRAEEEISYSNLTKHVFTGWYRNDNRVSSSPNVRLRVTEDIDLDIRYETWYFVRVTLPDGNHTGWVKRGEVLDLKAAEFITLGERERMRFKTWSDGVTAQNRTLEVLSPLNITAVYAKEFYITASSTHGSLEGLDGWYESGTRLEIPKELIWDNGTRAVFSRWVGADSDKPSTTVVVDGPLDLTASYRVQYFVEILSRQPVSHASGWFDRGSTLTIDARPLIRPAEERVRHVFGGWMGVGEEPEVVVYVDGPKTLQAVWAKEYLVTITNVLEHMEAWVGEGRNFTVEAKQVLPEGEGRRHVFKGWAGDVDGYEGLKAWLTADRPRKVMQLYDEEVLIRLAFEASDGKQVEAEAVVRHDSGVSYTIRGGDFWALKGGYEVVGVVYKGVDVKRSAHISVETPGTYTLPVKVYSLRLAVKDILGMPFAGAEVSVSNDEMVEAETFLDRNGVALLEHITHRAVNAHLKTAIYSYRFTVDPSNGFTEVRLPLTPTSTALLLAASLATGFTLYLLLGRGGKDRLGAAGVGQVIPSRHHTLI